MDIIGWIGAIIGVLLCIVILFVMQYWLPILLVILGFVILFIMIYSICFFVQKKKISQVVKACIISRKPIVRKEKEILGYEENRYYYPYWHSEIYRYIDVIIGYRVTFSVEYEDGTRDKITCREGGYSYNRLIKLPSVTNKRNDVVNIPIRKSQPENVVLHENKACFSYKIESTTDQSKAPGKVEIGYADGTKKVFEFDNEPKSSNATATPPKSSRLIDLRKNLTVDQTVFQYFGIVFKCNLVEYYDALQLNFEVSNTKLYASKIGKNDALGIKANVYDADGRLLCIEEEWIDYSSLKRGYAADYLFFISEYVRDAHSMKVYAVSDAKIDDIDEDEKTYTYCEVAFDRSGRTYHYRVENIDLNIGDKVYVPVGTENETKIAEIVDIEEFEARETPFPPEKTKFIIGKVD